jgi:hypothetical protein
MDLGSMTQVMAGGFTIREDKHGGFERGKGVYCCVWAAMRSCARLKILHCKRINVQRLHHKRERCRGKAHHPACLSLGGSQLRLSGAGAEKNEITDVNLE